jgi:hypothetical protein
LFYLDPRTDLKAFGFLAKIESDDHVNDKSPVTQEEMEYALCWRHSPAVLFPHLKKGKGKKTKRKKTPNLF